MLRVLNLPDKNIQQHLSTLLSLQRIKKQGSVQDVAFSFLERELKPSLLTSTVQSPMDYPTLPISLSLSLSLAEALGSQVVVLVSGLCSFPCIREESERRFNFP